MLAQQECRGGNYNRGAITEQVISRLIIPPRQETLPDSRRIGRV